jgi:hypothetical protein
MRWHSFYCARHILYRLRYIFPGEMFIRLKVKSFPSRLTVRREIADTLHLGLYP